MNICLVSREYPQETGWGGIGTYTYHLSHALVEKGHSVHVVCQGLERSNDYVNGRVSIHRIVHKNILEHKRFFKEVALRLEYSLTVYQKVKELIKEFSIEIVEGPNSSGEAFFLTLFRKQVPIVTRLHTPFWETMECLRWKSNLDRRLTCWIEDAVIMRSDLITCSTKAHTRIISEKMGINLNNGVALIPLGTELPDLDKKLYGNNTLFPEPMVLFIGRLERRKGIHTLIEAIPLIMQEISCVHFVVIGRDTYVDEDVVAFQGSDKNSFKSALIRKLPEGFRKYVHFLGYVSAEDVPRYLYHCDVFVAPSLYESFGQVYIEAMSYEKPVVGCKTGGVPEVVEDRKTGLLVEPDNPAQLADAVIRLLKDKDYAITMGIAGRRSVEEKFTREKMTEKTLKAYEAVLNKRRL